MARVNPLREVRVGNVGEWQLCFQWCRYRLDEEPVQYGYRFVWRRAEDGSIQAARGQARISNLSIAMELMNKAIKAGWGDRDWEQMVAAANRLKEAGYKVDLLTGYVGWENRELARTGQPTEHELDDAKLIHEWTR